MLRNTSSTTSNAMNLSSMANGPHARGLFWTALYALANSVHLPAIFKHCGDPSQSSILVPIGSVATSLLWLCECSTCRPPGVHAVYSVTGLPVGAGAARPSAT